VVCGKVSTAPPNIRPANRDDEKLTNAPPRPPPALRDQVPTCQGVGPLSSAGWFRAARRREPHDVYFPDDSHWNAAGQLQLWNWKHKWQSEYD